MKHQLLAGAAIAALVTATPAIAAPPQSPASPVYNWTGFYAGANFGYSWGVVDSRLDAPGFNDDINYLGWTSTFPASQNLNNFIGGVQAGHNWQINSGWVVGIEADIQGSAERNGITLYTSDIEGGMTQSRDAKIAWFGTVRGRVGALITPTTWLYATGGLAYGKVSLWSNVSFAGDPWAGFSYGESKVNIGYAVGAGLESAISDSRDWTWKVEYLYLDLGSLSGTGNVTLRQIPIDYGWNAKFVDHILRVGLNVKLR